MTRSSNMALPGRAQALAEFRRPTLCCLGGVVPLSTAPVGLAAAVRAGHGKRPCGARNCWTVDLPVSIEPANGGRAGSILRPRLPPDLFAQALMGYGLFQALLMLRLLPWIARQPFAPSYWAFTCGFGAGSAG